MPVSWCLHLGVNACTDLIVCMCVLIHVCACAIVHVCVLAHVYMYFCVCIYASAYIHMFGKAGVNPSYFSQIVRRTSKLLKDQYTEDFDIKALGHISE